MKIALLLVLVLGLASCATSRPPSLREVRQQYYSVHQGMALSAVIQLIGEPERLLPAGDLQWEYEDFSAGDLSITLTLSVHLDKSEHVETAKVELSTSRYPHIDQFPTPVRN